MFYQNIIAMRTGGVDKCKKALNKEESFEQIEFVQSAEKLNELIQAGAFDARCMNMTRDESESDFKNGKVAMYYNGNWFSGALEENNCPVKGKITARNFPIIDGSYGKNINDFLGGAIDCFMISKMTDYPEEAARLLKDVSYDFSKESFFSGVTQPAWHISLNNNKQSQLSKEISTMLENSRGFVLAWDTFLSGTDAEVHKDLVAKIFAGGYTPNDFAKDMQKLNENNKSINNIGKGGR